MEKLYSKLSRENMYKDSYPLGKEKQEDIKNIYNKSIKSRDDWSSNKFLSKCLLKDDEWLIKVLVTHVCQVGNVSHSCYLTNYGNIITEIKTKWIGSGDYREHFHKETYNEIKLPQQILDILSLFSFENKETFTYIGNHGYCCRLDHFLKVFKSAIDLIIKSYYNFLVDNKDEIDTLRDENFNKMKELFKVETKISNQLKEENKKLLSSINSIEKSYNMKLIQIKNSNKKLIEDNQSLQEIIDDNEEEILHLAKEELGIDINPENSTNHFIIEEIKKNYQEEKCKLESNYQKLKNDFEEYKNLYNIVELTKKNKKLEEENKKLEEENEKFKKTFYKLNEINKDLQEENKNRKKLNIKNELEINELRKYLELLEEKNNLLKSNETFLKSNKMLQQNNIELKELNNQLTEQNHNLNEELEEIKLKNKKSVSEKNELIESLANLLKNSN